MNSETLYFLYLHGFKSVILFLIIRNNFDQNNYTLLGLTIHLTIFISIFFFIIHCRARTMSPLIKCYIFKYSLIIFLNLCFKNRLTYFNIYTELNGHKIHI